VPNQFSAPRGLRAVQFETIEPIGRETQIRELSCGNFGRLSQNFLRTEDGKGFYERRNQSLMSEAARNEIGGFPLRFGEAFRREDHWNHSTGLVQDRRAKSAQRQLSPLLSDPIFRDWVRNLGRQSFDEPGIGWLPCAGRTAS